MKSLLITLLFSAPAFALTVQEGQPMLDEATAQIESVEVDIEASRKSIDEGTAAAQAAPGEKGAPMVEQATVEGREMAQQLNGKHAQLKAAHAREQEVLTRVGKELQVTKHGKRWVCTEAPKKSAPVVTQPAPERGAIRRTRDRS